MTALYIGIAGIFGAFARYGLSLAFNPAVADAFPWGTLLCNGLGCFLLTFITFRYAPRWPETAKLAVTTGFIGSFTTFSTFSMETVQFLNHHLWGLALLYTGLSLVLGLFLAWTGYAIANVRFVRKEEDHA
jgi:fluoride exporter